MSNWIYDSFEEEIFHQYLLELQDRKIISNIEKPASLVLSEAVPIKIGKKEVNLLNEHIYTGDFKFEVIEELPLFQTLHETLISPKQRKQAVIYTQGEDISKSYDVDGDYHERCFVEVKGNYDNNNMTRLFSLNQKWVYQRYGIYYNLVKVPKIFEKTFTPEAYLKTATGKDRKINFKVKLIDEYLNG